jgi:hypothetical protein
LYTFIVVWWRKSPTLLIPACIVAVMWTSTFLFTIISLTINKEHWRVFYGPSPVSSLPLLSCHILTAIRCIFKYWCWIDSQYLVFKIVGEYLWLWLALFVSILCYIPLLFWSLGYITMDDKDPWWKFHVHLKKQGHPDEARLNSFYIIAYAPIPSLVTRFHDTDMNLDSPAIRLSTAS